MLGFDRQEDSFTLLQGDIVSTESAFLLGERVTSARYIALNSSCDLVPGRRQYASFLHIKEVHKDDGDVKKKFDLLLRFKKRESMYLLLESGVKASSMDRVPALESCLLCVGTPVNTASGTNL